MRPCRGVLQLLQEAFGQIHETCTIGVPIHHEVGPCQNGLGVERLQEGGVDAIDIEDTTESRTRVLAIPARSTILLELALERHRIGGEGFSVRPICSACLTRLQELT